MKRSNVWFSLAGIAVLTVALISGCTRSLTAPTSAQPTATNTPLGGLTYTYTSTKTLTPTPVVNTSTPTVTRSFTATATTTNINTTIPGATNTYTPSVTNSFTPSLTATASDTATITPTATNSNTTIPGATATDTPTVTATLTATSTVTATATSAIPCTENSVVTDYPFDTTTGCWYVDPTATGNVVTALNNSTTTFKYGTGSAHLAVTEPATAKNIQFQVDYTTPQNLTGLALTGWIYIDAPLANSGTGVQFFCMSNGSSWSWTSGGGSGSGVATGKWVYITWPITATDITTVDRIGVQLYGMPANATGNIYFDDIKLVSGLCSANSVITNFTMEGSLNCWKVDSGSVGVVSGWGLSTAQAHGGTGSMGVTVQEGATSSAVQMDLNYSPAQNLTGMVLGVWIWVDPALAGSTVQMFFQSGATDYNWVNNTGVAFAAAQCGSWQYVSFDPTSIGTWTIADAANVQLIGIQLSGVPANATGAVYLDDITLSGGSTATATASPTVTSTATITDTPADTNTPVPGTTDTYTATVTATSTVTSSPTSSIPCTENSVVTSYPFDTTLGCWYVDPTATGNVATSLTISNSTFKFGTGAMHIAVTEPATATNIQVESDYATPQNLTGLTLTAWIYVDASMASGSTGMQFFCQSNGSSWSWTNGGGMQLPSTAAGKWNYVTWTISAADITTVDRIGLQFYGMPANATGNVYIDNVQLVSGLCNANSVMTDFTMEGSLNCWKVDSGTIGAGVVSGWGLSTVQAHGGTGSMGVTVQEGATSSNVQLDLNYSPVQNLTGMVFGAWIWVDPALAGSTVQVFFQGGAGDYNWVNSTGVAFAAAQCGSWQYITFDPSTITSWVTNNDATHVQLVGVQLTGVPANAAGAVYLDDVTLTGAATSTPTVTPTITDTPADTNTPIPGTTDTYTVTPTVTPTVTATATTSTSSACSVLIDSFESATENGTFSAGGAFASVSYSALNATLGSQSLDLDITTGGPNNIMNWANFDPGNLINVTQIVVDYTADASLFTGGSYYQFALVGQSSVVGNYWSPFTPATDFTAGSHTVTFAVDFTLGGAGHLTASDKITNMVFVWNTDGNGTGNIYFDNVRFVGTTTACPPSSCFLMNNFETTNENGTLSSGGAFASVSYSALNATRGVQSLDLDLTTGGANNVMNWGGFSPARFLDATEITMDITPDASLLTGGSYYQLELVAQSSITGNYWSQITLPIDITSGTNTVHFPIDFTLGGGGHLTGTDPITNLVFVWNTDGNGTGNIYFDNVQIHNGAGCNP